MGEEGKSNNGFIQDDFQSQSDSQSEIEVESKESQSQPVLEEQAKSSSISEVRSGEKEEDSSPAEKDQESVIGDGDESSVAESREKESPLETAKEDSSVETEKESPLDSSKEDSSVETEKESPLDSSKEDSSVETEKESPLDSSKEDSSVETEKGDDPQAEEEEEERNPALTKFSKRFRFSRHKMSLDEIEDPTKTYYPKDHMREGNLWSIRKTLIEEEKQALEAWRPRLGGPLTRYEEMEEYLSLKDNSHKFVSAEELAQLQQLTGKEQERFRKKLEGQLRLATQKDGREREKRRKAMMARMQHMGDGPVCDGCPVKRGLRLARRGGDDTLVRKFVGNEERFDIHNSTHCEG